MKSARKCMPVRAARQAGVVSFSGGEPFCFSGRLCFCWRAMRGEVKHARRVRARANAMRCLPVQAPRRNAICIQGKFPSPPPAKKAVPTCRRRRAPRAIKTLKKFFSPVSQSADAAARAFCSEMKRRRGGAQRQACRRFSFLPQPFRLFSFRLFRSARAFYAAATRRGALLTPPCRRARQGR